MFFVVFITTEQVFCEQIGLNLSSSSMLCQQFEAINLENSPENFIEQHPSNYNPSDWYHPTIEPTVSTASPSPGYLKVF